MSTYHKIKSPFVRHVDGPDRGKFIHGEWSCDEFDSLADNEWFWTEKIDGTNVRVIWDGHRPEFRGRTDNAQLHPALMDHLYDTFSEEILEQVFGSNPAIVYAEGIGEKIQGGLYGPEYRAVIFDVYCGGFWLKREDVYDVARRIGTESVNVVFVGTVPEAISLVTRRSGERDFEGIVGTPDAGLLSRAGERIIMKVKCVDFR